jgi:hypothetical protein
VQYEAVGRRSSLPNSSHWPPDPQSPLVAPRSSGSCCDRRGTTAGSPQRRLSRRGSAAGALTRRLCQRPTPAVSVSRGLRSAWVAAVPTTTSRNLSLNADPGGRQVVAVSPTVIRTSFPAMSLTAMCGRAAGSGPDPPAPTEGFLDPGRLDRRASVGAGPARPRRRPRLPPRRPSNTAV